MAERDDHADVPVPPPLLFIAPLSVGMLVDRHLRVRRLRTLRGVVAGALGVLAAGLFGWATASMYRAGTSPEPWEPATALVRDGPFRRTRNPIYLAYALAYVAVAVWRGSWVALGLLPGVVRLTERMAIEPEEAYLRGRFARVYQAYASATRRWL